MSKPFRMQFHEVLMHQIDGTDPVPVVMLLDEPVHVVRSFRTAGSKPRKMRPNAKYVRKANRRARRYGFTDAAHAAQWFAFQNLKLAALRQQSLKEAAGG